MADLSRSRAEKLVVCVGPSPSSGGLIRAAQKLAAGLQAEWLAVYVETPRMLRLLEAERQRAVSNLRLAEHLGAETLTLRGRGIAQEVVGLARQREATMILIGRPGPRARWQELLYRGPVAELLRLSGDLEVRILPGAAEPPPPTGMAPPKAIRRPGYELGLVYFLLATGLCFLMYPYFDLPNLIMVYLLGVLVTAIHCGRGPAILSSLLSVLAFDFCFVPPRWTLTVDEAKYFVTFGVMFVVAVIISHLASLIRRQAEAARLQERQTAAMFALSRDLAGTRGVDKILQGAVKHLSEIFQCQAGALLPDESGKLHPAVGDLAALIRQDVIKEMGVAQWAYEAGQMAGWLTQNRSDSPIIYVPLQAASGTLGVLALRPRDPQAELWLLPEQLRLRLLESLAKQVALALEVERVEKTALAAQLAMETERLRTTLLSSVTHDLQTPLAAIVGSASSLLGLPGQLTEQVAREMLTNIYEEAERLSRLVNNLLNMAKLESGSLKLREELQPLEEVLGAALNRLERKLADRPVKISLPPDLPMVPLDAALAEQVFLNLLENSLKYSPPGGAISIAASRKGQEIEVEVTDAGPGFPPAALDKVFDMFYQGTQDPKKKGYGLGLSICRAIVAAHGGRIWAENLPGGGAAVRFTLPLAPEKQQ